MGELSQQNKPKTADECQTCVQKEGPFYMGKVEPFQGRQKKMYIYIYLTISIYKDIDIYLSISIYILYIYIDRERDSPLTVP